MRSPRRCSSADPRASPRACGVVRVLRAIRRPSPRFAPTPIRRAYPCCSFRLLELKAQTAPRSVQVDFYLIDVEPHYPRAFVHAHALNVEQHDETPLGLGQRLDGALQLRRELALLVVPRGVPVLGALHVVLVVVAHEPAGLAQAIETSVARDFHEPLARPPHGGTLLPIPDERLLRHVLGFRTVPEQRARHAMYAAMVLRHGESVPPIRHGSGA